MYPLQKNVIEINKFGYDEVCLIMAEYFLLCM